MWREFRLFDWLFTMWPLLLPSSAEGSFVRTLEKMEFQPKTSWFGLKSCTYWREILQIKAHANAITKEQLISSLIFLAATAVITLYLSTNPLLQALSGAVVLILTFETKLYMLKCYLEGPCCMILSCYIIIQTLLHIQ